MKFVILLAALSLFLAGCPKDTAVADASVADAGDAPSDAGQADAGDAGAQ